MVIIQFKLSAVLTRSSMVSEKKGKNSFKMTSKIGITRYRIVYIFSFGCAKRIYVYTHMLVYSE